MKNTKHKIELLAPAGDFECLMAAVNAGADAVYLGLENFNMRARARNFKLSDLPRVSKICKPKKIKLYLTLNIIVYDSELKKVEKIIKKAKKFIDAIICSDISVMLLCKKYKIPFHVSTQCSVSNSETAKFYKKLGASRIVLARELNLKQIKQISKIMPVEVFAHGAMCLSVSGRCLMSQFLFNESANRGRCIHPCRRFYNIRDNEGNELRIDNNYILSAKDICTLPFIEQLKKAGISAFKIEGRNKEPEYVSTVISIYRKSLDKELTKKEIEESLKELSKVYNKGFSSGFYLKLPTSDDFSKTEDSSSTQSKQFIGKINHYYPKVEVGLIKLNTGKLKVGDEILIIGKTTGVLKHKIQSMESHHKQITEAKKGEEIGIKLPLCRKNDELYKVIKKN
ncbi:MAG: U32 family peptidase [Candidatus Nanoarchaeia archaeon]|nr:U32 family peptidase [Candidatus Nanoarchaeia archaeon]MDD5740762.1 U32 family peptidase [Candidatus Nanoarchaeia archaeon]